MGTFLKVVGVLALIWFGLAAIGCSMIVSALSHGGPPSAFSSSSQSKARDDVLEAIRDDRIDLAQLPTDLRHASSITVTLSDGTTRTLGNGAGDRFVRTLLAARVESRGSAPSYAGSYSAPQNQPHFKPGEPMLDPTPGGSH